MSAAPDPAQPAQPSGAPCTPGAPGWWPQAKPHLEALLDQDPSTWDAYLDEVLDGQPDLRREVEAYLDADRADARAGLLEAGAADAAPSLLEDLAESGDPDAAAGIDRTIGGWRLLGELGRGGMATVHRAERRGDGFVQEAALKLLHHGIDSVTARARFRTERQVLARLRHDGIASLIDGGVADDGRPYVVMELVDGRPLVRSCDEEDLDVDARLRRMIDVCEAVAYAHRRLVVHRDLKPSNVLVTPEGRVKLLDFGIAKVLDPELLDDDAQPLTVFAPLTPAYASPEQRAGDAATTVSDVYALGLLLWELLVGTRAQRGRPGDGAAPGRPSDEVEDPRRAARLRGDLDAIVGKCLAPRPEDRYQDAQTLADDLGRHLRGEAVTARAPSAGERLVRWASHNRLAAAALSLAALSLLAGTAASSFLGLRAVRESERAREEAAKSRAAMIFVEEMLDAADDRPVDQALTIRQLLSEADARIDEDLAEQPELGAEVLSLLVRFYQGFALHPEAVAAAERALELARSEAERGEADAHDLEVGVALAEERLGYALVLAGEPLRAVDYIERALATLETRLGPDAPATMVALRHLTYVDEVRTVRETRELRRELLQRERSRAAGADDARVAQALNDHARTLYFTGRVDQAVEELTESVAMRRRLGLPPTELAVSLGNLSMVLSSQGRLDEAEAAAAEAVGLVAAAKGAEHPATATPRLRLAEALHLQGKLAEALTEAETAVAIRALYPQSPVRLGAALRVRAEVLCSTGDRSGAARAAADYAEARRLISTGHPESGWRVGRIDAEAVLCAARSADPSELPGLARRLDDAVARVAASLGDESPLVVRYRASWPADATPDASSARTR